VVQNRRFPWQVWYERALFDSRGRRGHFVDVHETLAGVVHLNATRNLSFFVAGTVDPHLGRRLKRVESSVS